MLHLYLIVARVENQKPKTTKFRRFWVKEHRHPETVSAITVLPRSQQVSKPEAKKKLVNGTKTPKNCSILVKKNTCLSHVKELEKGMLSVCPRLSEVNLTDVIGNRPAVPSHSLAVALHRQLKQIWGGKWETKKREGNTRKNEKKHDGEVILLILFRLCTYSNHLTGGEEGKGAERINRKQVTTTTSVHHRQIFACWMIDGNFRNASADVYCCSRIARIV